MNTKPPPPGSPEARTAGCKCPVLDNGHGRGYMGMPGIYVISGNCPLHAKPQNTQPVEIKEPHETRKETPDTVESEAQ